MKNILISIIFLLLFLDLSAQKTEKVGYINSDSLIHLIPGRDTVLKIIRLAVNAYEDTLREFDINYRALYDAFKRDSSSMTKDNIKIKIAQLLGWKKKMNDFKSDAKENLDKLQDSLFLPLIEKAQKAIADVAKENGYIYIIDTSLSNGMVLVYADKSGDIMPLVKKKLGIR